MIARPIRHSSVTTWVVRRRQAPLSQIAKDFRFSDATLHSWLKRAGIEDGVRQTKGPLQGSDSRPP